MYTRENLSVKSISEYFLEKILTVRIRGLRTDFITKSDIVTGKTEHTANILDAQ